MKKSSREFSHSPRLRKLTRVGPYEAWIAVAFEGGPSAHAWEIRELDGDVPVDSDAVRGGPRSSQWRAYISAAYRAVEALPDGSTLTICCGHSPIVDAINHGVDEWRENGWLKRDGTSVAEWKLWKLFAEEREGRNIKTCARLPDTAKDREIITERSQRASEEMHHG